MNQSNILLLFDVFGTFVFALSGAAKAISKKMDFLGVIVFAITVGCAGGMIRDVLIGAVPVAVYQNSVYIIVAFSKEWMIFWNSNIAISISYFHTSRHHREYTTHVIVLVIYSTIYISN